VTIRLKYQWIREKLAPYVAGIRAAILQKGVRDENYEAYLYLVNLM
jgi:hypothetical protein